jgi:phosphoribosylformimino-5-aminoimidazole carboxamide ribotide isomerase
LPFRVLPVIDLLGGVAVHARGGDRAAYRPVRSVLADSPDPVLLASRFRDRLGLEDVYVADLDAIAGRGANTTVIRRIADLGLTVWADTGLRTAADARGLKAAGVSVIVAGTETLRGPSELSEIARTISPDSTALSLDFRGETLSLAPCASWPDGGPGAIVDAGRLARVRKIVWLDLARVGRRTGAEPPALMRDRPDVAVFVGGGVAGLPDLLRLRDAGAAGALVATALHDGRIGPRDIDRLRCDEYDSLA